MTINETLISGRLVDVLNVRHELDLNPGIFVVQPNLVLRGHAFIRSDKPEHQFLRGIMARQRIALYELSRGGFDQGFFCNLNGVMPGGYRTEFPDVIKDMPLTSGSKRLFQRKLRGLIADAELACKSCGYADLSDVEAIAIDWKFNGHNERMFPLIKDVYIKLIEQGYDHEDLIT